MTSRLSHFNPIAPDDTVVYVERFNRKVRATELFFDDLRSANYVAGTSGFRIDSEGNAEFNELVYAGQIDVGQINDGNLGSGVINTGALNADDITAGTLSVARIGANSLTTGKIELTASLVAGQSIRSTTYTPGSAGWAIDADGSAEFQNVTVRGTLNAGDLSAGTILAARFANNTVSSSVIINLQALDIVGDITLTGSGVLRTDSSGARLEITQSAEDRIKFYNGSGTHIASIGLFSPSYSGISLEVSGTTRLFIASTVITATEPIRGANESAATPTYSFDLDTNSGMYLVSGDTLGFSAGGSARLQISSSVITASEPIRGGDESASTPTYSFNNNTNTGMYYGSNYIRWAINGTEKMSLGNDFNLAENVFMTALNSSGSVTNVGITGSNQLVKDTSSGRYKKNIRDWLAAERAHAIRGVRDLRLISFKMRTNIAEGNTDRHLGLLAEQAFEVLPEIVMLDDEGRPDAIKSGQTQAVLVACIQDLYARVEALEGT